MPTGTNNLSKLAADRGLAVQVTEPFTEFQGGPPGLNVPQSFSKVAFSLSPAQPLSEEIVMGEDGAYILGFHSRLPSFVPPFEEVQNRVMEDFRRARSTELAQAAGRELYQQLTNALPQGKAFAEVVSAANLNPVDLPPLSKNTTEIPQLPSSTFLSPLKDAAFSLAPGEVSPFTPTRNGGVIVRLQSKIPVSEEKLKSDLPEFTRSLQQQRQFESYSAWLRSELEQARISLPGDEQQAMN
jgi:parvulin-like peptidyl-prolyl isomerase